VAAFITIYVIMFFLISMMFFYTFLVNITFFSSGVSVRIYTMEILFWLKPLWVLESPTDTAYFCLVSW